MKFEQNISGPNAKGTQIGKMRDYFEGNKNEYGLSAEDLAKLVEAIKQLPADKLQKLEEPVRELTDAQADKEKESPSKKIKAYLAEFGISTAGSLTANGVWLLASKLIGLYPK